MSTADMKRDWNTMKNENEDDEKTKRQPDSRESSTSRKRNKPNGNSESDKKSGSVRKPLELETDPGILQRRQKQIDYGKNTVGYHNYLQQVPSDKRSKQHPKTPDKYTKYSRRSWDTLIKMWRKRLHEYDTENNTANSSHTEEDYDDLSVNDADVDDENDGLSLD